MLALPPLTNVVPSLNDTALARLKRKRPSGIPATLADCMTCHGTKRFRWMADPEQRITMARTEVPVLGGEPRTVIEAVTPLPEFADWECSCIQQRRLLIYLLAHNLGDKAVRWGWGDTDYVSQETVRELRGYADSAVEYHRRGIGVFLFSPTGGTGKTLLAALLLKSFIAQGVEGYWITFNELLSMHTATWRDTEELDWFDANIRHAPVLVIDDLGKEARSREETVNAALDLIFRTRVQNGMVTIFTSNLNPDQVYETYTPALGSLVTEACLPYDLSGRDMRKLSIARTQAELRHGLSRPIVLA